MKTIKIYSINYSRFSKINSFFEEFTLHGEDMLDFVKSIDINTIDIFLLRHDTRMRVRLDITENIYDISTVQTLRGILE